MSRNEHLNKVNIDERVLDLIQSLSKISPDLLSQMETIKEIKKRQDIVISKLSYNWHWIRDADFREGRKGKSQELMQVEAKRHQEELVLLIIERLLEVTKGYYLIVSDYLPALRDLDK